MSVFTLTLLTVLALIIHALFAGFEAALVAIDRIRIRHMAEEEGHAGAKRLAKFIESPELLVVTATLGSALTLVAGSVTLYYETSSFWLAVAIAIPCFLILGETVPRSLALIQPLKFVLLFRPYVTLFLYIAFPVVWPIATLLRLFRKLTGAPVEELGALMTTEEEFLDLVDESAEAGGIEREEQEMIHSVIDLQTTKAQEIMVARTNTQAVADTETRSGLIERFEATGLTRLPVYKESLDQVIGVVNVYDVLVDESPQDEDISRFVRDLVYVPDSMPADAVLQMLKESRQHMAVVTDEYGGTDGIITLEDALEEIFGEIHDEHDQAMDMFRQVGPRGFVIDARMPLDELGAAIGLPFGDHEVETVAGWVMWAAGRIPAQGEKIKHEGFRVTILESKRNQIDKIRLDILDEQYVAPPGSPQPASPPPHL